MTRRWNSSRKPNLRLGASAGSRTGGWRPGTSCWSGCSPGRSAFAREVRRRQVVAVLAHARHVLRDVGARERAEPPRASAEVGTTRLERSLHLGTRGATAEEAAASSRLETAGRRTIPWRAAARRYTAPRRAAPSRSAKLRQGHAVLLEAGGELRAPRYESAAGGGGRGRGRATASAAPAAAAIT
jgi:hypothetical protein